MSRYDRYYPNDTEPVTDGDTAFVGVNAKLAPELLTIKPLPMSKRKKVAA